MPHISKHKLPRETEQALIKNLNLILSSIHKHEEMLLFLDALLTDTEKLMLAKRIAIIVLIAERLTDSEIANRLHVTRITVAKMRYFYEARAKDGYGIALRKIANDKQLQEFKKFLLSLARYSIRAAGGYVKPTILD